MEEETQSNDSKSDVGSPKVKRELVAETDFFGETKVKHKLTTYTWALKDFKTLTKIQKHMDTKSFTLCDDSNIKCFLSVDISTWMSVHINFCDAVPASHNYEITLHIINEENLSSFHDVLYASDILKGHKVSFEKFLLIESEEFDSFLVNGYLFLWCEISRVDSYFSFRNTVIDVEEHEISDDIPKLWKEQLLTDVTIIAGEKEFQAHKCILAARSPVFLAMFQSDMKENHENKVYLKDADPECLEKLLDFIYLDKVENVQQNTEKLLAMADKYDIRGLKLLCAQELCNTLDTDSAIKTLIWADRYNVQELKDRVLIFIRSHMKEVIETSAYNDILTEYPNLLKEVFCCKSPVHKKRKLDF